MNETAAVHSNPATGECIRWLLRSADTDGELVRLEMWCAPGGGVRGTHIHEYSEERFEVISGRLVLESGGDRRGLLPGEHATVPAGTAHRWCNGGDDELHMLVELDNPGRFEEMLEAAFAAGRAGQFDARGRMKPLAAATLVRRFPDEIAPPWPRWLRRLAFPRRYPNTTRRDRTMRKLTTIASVTGVLAAAVAASPAGAVTVSYDSSGTLHYQAAPGETNRPFFQEDYGSLLINDNEGVQFEDTSGKCQPGYYSNMLSCPMPNGVRADLGDRDDRSGVGSGLPASLRIEVLAGDGKDKLTGQTDNPVVFDGGSGTDEITGGEAADTLTGGAGDDTIIGRGAGDQVIGGDGNDNLQGDGHNVENGADLIDGGAGIDKVESEWNNESGLQPPLNVTFDVGADDGRPGEGDDVRGVEHMFLYATGTFVGTDAAERIQLHQVTEPSTIRGGGGDDDLDASDGADRLDGGTGNDVVDGGFGDDQLVGGPGADRLHGDTPEGECSYIYCKNAFGNDTIDARDGEVDSVDCGVGQDRVMADAGDAVAGDCETVERGSGPGPDPRPEPRPEPKPDPEPGALCTVPKLAGLKQKAAEKRLAAAGCRVKVKKARNRRVARGRVIKASRKAGAQVAQGTRVTITVSRGR